MTAAEAEARLEIALAKLKLAEATFESRQKNENLPALYLLEAEVAATIARQEVKIAQAQLEETNSAQQPWKKAKP